MCILCRVSDGCELCGPTEREDELKPTSEYYAHIPVNEKKDYANIPVNEKKDYAHIPVGCWQVAASQLVWTDL